MLEICTHDKPNEVPQAVNEVCNNTHVCACNTPPMQRERVTECDGTLHHKGDIVDLQKTPHSIGGKNNSALIIVVCAQGAIKEISIQQQDF